MPLIEEGSTDHRTHKLEKTWVIKYRSSFPFQPCICESNMQKIALIDYLAAAFEIWEMTDDACLLALSQFE